MAKKLRDQYDPAIKHEHPANMPDAHLRSAEGDKLEFVSEKCFFKAGVIAAESRRVAGEKQPFPWPPRTSVRSVEWLNWMAALVAVGYFEFLLTRKLMRSGNARLATAIACNRRA